MTGAVDERRAVVRAANPQALAHTRGHATPRGPRSPDRAARPALRGLPSERARPPGSQEARPDPRWRGHRVLGRSTETRRKQRLGYDHFEVIVDDRSRKSVVVQVPDETAASAVSALETALAVFAADGITVERVLTDNGLAYRSNAYRAALGDRHPSRTRPYRPQTNGKAERFIGTLVREWAYARPYRSNAERLAALPVFVDFYNQRRPHAALGGLSPTSVVNNVRGD